MGPPPIGVAEGIGVSVGVGVCVGVWVGVGVRLGKIGVKVGVKVGPSGELSPKFSNGSIVAVGPGGVKVGGTAKARASEASLCWGNEMAGTRVGKGVAQHMLPGSAAESDNKRVSVCRFWLQAWG